MTGNLRNTVPSMSTQELRRRKSARCQTPGVLLTLVIVGGRIFITWHSTFSNDVEFLSTKDSIIKISHGPVYSK